MDQIIKRNLEINCIFGHNAYDGTLWHR